VGIASCDSKKVGLLLCNESSIVGTEISSIPEDCNGSVISSTLSADSIPSDGESVDASTPGCDSLCHDDPVACKHNKSDPNPSLLLSHEEEEFFSDALDALVDLHPVDPFAFADNEVVVGTRQSCFDVSVIGNIETLLFDGCPPADDGADTVCCSGDCVSDRRNPSQQRSTCCWCAWSR